jgi:hypothetical protein
MTFSTGYRGTFGGSVQTTYYDVPGIAIPGQLAFASDINYTDAIFVGETNGLRAGAGIRLLADSDGLDFQKPSVSAYLPEGDETNAEFGGIVVFDHAMQSDENGLAGWANGRVARILKPSRMGGRIYVNVKDTIVPGTSTVNWVIAVDDAGKYALGDFCPTALGGGSAGTSVALANCSWVSGATTSGIALLEMHGTIIPVLSTDAS